jgi:hypothetical protein
VPRTEELGTPKSKPFESSASNVLMGRRSQRQMDKAMYSALVVLKGNFGLQLANPMNRAAAKYNDVARARDCGFAKMSHFTSPHTCKVAIDIGIHFITTCGFED